MTVTDLSVWVRANRIQHGRYLWLNLAPIALYDQASQDLTWKGPNNQTSVFEGPEILLVEDNNRETRI